MISPSRIPSYIRRVYIHFGIMPGDWPKHYDMDFGRDERGRRKSTAAVRKTLRLISRCISKPAGNRERAHSRYYQRKQMTVGLD